MSTIPGTQIHTRIACTSPMEITVPAAHLLRQRVQLHKRPKVAHAVHRALHHIPQLQHALLPVAAGQSLAHNHLSRVQARCQGTSKGSVKSWKHQSMIPTILGWPTLHLPQSHACVGLVLKVHILPIKWELLQCAPRSVPSTAFTTKLNPNAAGVNFPKNAKKNCRFCIHVPRTLQSSPNTSTTQKVHRKRCRSRMKTADSA